MERQQRVLIDILGPMKEAKFGERVQKKPTNAPQNAPISGYRIPSQHAEKFISKLQAVRGYKVLGLKTEGNHKIAIDLFSGKIVNLGGKGVESRITQSVQCYESKSSALSEKYSHNGTIPRILVSFDGWGFTKRMYGGQPSFLFEFVRYVRIIECLDPPTIPKRFCEKAEHPYYFGKRDNDANAKPQRERSNRMIRAERMLRRP